MKPTHTTHHNEAADAAQTLTLAGVKAYCITFFTAHGTSSSQIAVKLPTRQGLAKCRGIAASDDEGEILVLAPNPWSDMGPSSYVRTARNWGHAARLILQAFDEDQALWFEAAKHEWELEQHQQALDAADEQETFRRRG